MLSLDLALKFFVSECLHEAAPSDSVTPLKQQPHEDKCLIQASIFLLSTLKKKIISIRTKRSMSKYKLLLEEAGPMKQSPRLNFWRYNSDMIGNSIRLTYVLMLKQRSGKYKTLIWFSQILICVLIAFYNLKLYLKLVPKAWYWHILTNSDHLQIISLGTYPRSSFKPGPDCFPNAFAWFL